MKIIPSIFFVPGDSFFISNPSKILLLVLLLYHDFVRLFYRTLYRIFYGTFMTYATNCFAVGDSGIFWLIWICSNYYFVIGKFLRIIILRRFSTNFFEGIKILLSTSIVRIKQRYTIMENNRQSNTFVSLYIFCISQICHNPIMYAHNNIRD